METNRYVLATSNRVPNAGHQIIRVGLPVHSDMVNDICICCIGSLDFLPLNSNVLRQALLRDPEMTKALLGIEVKDFRANKTKEKKSIKKTEPKSEEEKK